MGFIYLNVFTLVLASINLGVCIEFFLATRRMWTHGQIHLNYQTGMLLVSMVASVFLIISSSFLMRKTINNFIETRVGQIINENS